MNSFIISKTLSDHSPIELTDSKPLASAKHVFDIGRARPKGVEDSLESWVREGICEPGGADVFAIIIGVKSDLFLRAHL